MVSKTKIKSRARKKTSPDLKETIALALKNPGWNEVAKLLSSSTRKLSSVNLFEIDRQTSAGDTVLIPGKVLSKGSLTKKVSIVALSISQSALDKLKETKSDFKTIKEEILKNKKFEGVKILR